jgi:Asp/Glu/hydantoin racemase
MMSMQLSITLLHATSVAMQPIHQAFESEWNDAVLSNLLDDGLTRERAKSGPLTEALVDRFVRLVTYAYDSGADAVLATCSAFGPAIERAAAALPIPVVKPNEAMFQAAIACGTRIAMIATFAPSVSTMEAEFYDEVARVKAAATLTTIVVDEAIDWLRVGDVDTHNRLIAERARELTNYDAIVLAHFSTSRASQAVKAVVGSPVFTAPESAVRQLRARMMR